MSEFKVCCQSGNPALGYAAAYLQRSGVTVTETPDQETTHFLLPVPTRCFDTLPENAVIVGGNLHCLPGYRVIDLLKDPEYLARNAAITARCAIPLIGRELIDLPVLVLGWGRIGKCLGQLLWRAGANVTIAARKETDRAMAKALGYEAIPITDAQAALPQFGAVINTVPAMLISVDGCASDCVCLELASRPGMAGGNIIDGRGLPGKYAPEASGTLIAQRFLALAQEGTT